MPLENSYATQNLYEAAFLLCKGFNLAGKRREGSKVIVMFQGAEASTAALKYYNGAKVEAKAFTDAYRTLKDYVFER